MYYAIQCLNEYYNDYCYTSKIEAERSISLFKSIRPFIEFKIIELRKPIDPNKIITYNEF